MIFSTLRELDTNIRAGAPLPVYLLYGEETRQIESARERLAKAVTGDSESVNLYRVDGSREVDWDSIGDMLWSVSFVAGRKCVIVDDLNLVLMNAAAFDKLGELTRTTAEEGALVITVRNSSSNFNKKDSVSTKLLKLCDTAGGVCRFAVMGRGDAAKFARSLAAKSGCVLEQGESLLLADYCGLDTLRIASEVEKLCAYHAHTGDVTQQDIEEMVAPVVDANVFQLGDRILRGDYNGALAVVDDLLFLQERPESILTILTMSFVDLFRAASVRRASIPEATARKELGYGGSYRFTKALEQCGRLSVGTLDAILELLADADARMKQSGADGRVVLEVAIAGILRHIREDKA